MKFALAILAVLASASSLNAYQFPSVCSGTLAKELQDFLDMIPVDRVVEVAKAYMVKDAEFRTAIRLLHTQTMKLLVRDIEDAPEVKELLNYMQNAGLNVYYLLYKVKESLDMQITSPVGTDIRITGKITGFYNDISNLIPMDEVSYLSEMKQKYSRVFAEFEIKSRDVDMSLILHNSEHLQKLVQQAEQANINATVFERSLDELLVTNVALVFL